MKRFIRLTVALLLAACSEAAPVATMAAPALAVSVFVGTQAYSCVPVPGPTGGATSTGGSTSTGGRSSTGGNLATGGKTPAGGSVSTGGATPVACPTITWPSVLSGTPAEQTKKAVHRTFPPRKYRTLRALTDYEVSATICSSWNEPLVLSPLDQGSTGSCTGNAAAGMISTWPFTDASHYSEDVARTIYENGTCVDNGCSIPCSCGSCKNAFCPTTNANDTGSQGNSVMAYLVKMGWLKGNKVVQSTDALALALTHSSCIFGIDWYYSMMSTDSSGHTKVTKSSGLAGGHEPHSLAWDAILSRFWGRNSWGKWGMCRSADDCGYFWLSPADLITLNFDANCPVL
jgi:hypothetical protein